MVTRCGHSPASAQPSYCFFKDFFNRSKPPETAIDEDHPMYWRNTDRNDIVIFSEITIYRIGDLLSDLMIGLLRTTNKTMKDLYQYNFDRRYEWMANMNYEATLESDRDLTGIAWEDWADIHDGDRDSDSPNSNFNDSRFDDYDSSPDRNSEYQDYGT